MHDLIEVATGHIEAGGVDAFKTSNATPWACSMRRSPVKRTPPPSVGRRAISMTLATCCSPVSELLYMSVAWLSYLP